ncbi:MAG: hypothetical protein V1720_02125 [bacterium]
MYLRRINHRQINGRNRSYWVLIESYRTESGPRQRIVSYLGEIYDTGRLGIKQAAEGSDYYQASLFKDTEEPEWVEVDIRKVRTENSLRFGDIYVGLELIKKLHLDKIFSELLGEGKTEISESIVAQILVISRFCEASSRSSYLSMFFSICIMENTFANV